MTKGHSVFKLLIETRQAASSNLGEARLEVGVVWE